MNILSTLLKLLHHLGDNPVGTFHLLLSLIKPARSGVFIQMEIQSEVKRVKFTFDTRKRGDCIQVGGDRSPS